MKTANITAAYVDHMGADLSVVNAARVSFDKESDWEPGTETVLLEADRRLVNYLAKHDHWSPFAHTTVKFHVKAPIFVARQLVKHQVGGVWNEVSRRYVDSEPEFYMPGVWRARPDGSIKQGSGDAVVDQAISKTLAEIVVEQALSCYNELLARGIAPEQARMVLPQNTMTEWVWTGSLMFWARVCQLRLDSHAQAETRVVAEGIDVICGHLFPYSWKALRERHSATNA